MSHLSPIQMIRPLIFVAAWCGHALAAGVPTPQPVQFDPPRGFYEAPFELKLSCPTAGAMIRYTTDSSMPTPTHGSTYAGPLPVNTPTCVRAVAVLADGTAGAVQTHTYIFAGQVLQQTNTPAGFPTKWGTAKADYEMDPDVVGAGRDDPNVTAALMALPAVSLVMDVNDLFGPAGIYANYKYDGSDWERAVSAELIDPNGMAGFQIDCGIRLHGRVGRMMPKKSFRLLFKSKYGPTKLDYPLLGAGAAERFDQLILRSGFNDSYMWGREQAQFIRDQYVRDLQRAMGWPAPRGRFVHLYINGLYWGLYNLTERPDGSFASSYMGGDKDDWDILNAGEPVGDSSTTLWDEMLALVRQGMASDAAYQRLQGNNPDGTRNPTYTPYLDVDNYIDYLILNFFVGNSDWPEVNWYAGIDRVSPSGFRFFAWDAECTVDLNSDVTFNCTLVDTGVAEPYAWLCQNAQFRARFSARVAQAFAKDGPLTVNPAALYTQLASIVEPAIPAESARWADAVTTVPPALPQWRTQRQSILESYLPQRAAIVLSQLKTAGLFTP